MTDLTDDVVRQWLDRAMLEKMSPDVYTPSPELRRRIIALAEALLKERAEKDRLKQRNEELRDEIGDVVGGYDHD